MSEEQEVNTTGKKMVVNMSLYSLNNVLKILFFAEVTTPGTTTEDTPPVLEATKDEKSEEEVQLEPTQDEMERERLTARAEQVSNRPLFILICDVTLSLNLY